MTPYEMQQRIEALHVVRAERPLTMHESIALSQLQRDLYRTQLNERMRMREARRRSQWAR